MASRATAGVTLAELLAVLAVAAIGVSLALPSFSGQIMQARRADAVDALQRVQAAQELHRAHHGRYAVHLEALQGAAARSPEGWYAVRLHAVGGDAYRATAVAEAAGPQRGDRDCARITLEVRSGFASHGPSRRCWGR
ncbi:MAG: pilus assembly protein PilE [Rubrivivax sp.]|jgi:type IV pilus assembly protein PilE|nr:pilus assembly protein PilE [Rubrivivax sp.]